VNLAEEFLLLSLDDEKGSLGGWVDYGLAAAVLIELGQQGRIGVDDGHVVVRGGDPTGDEVLDRAMRVIAGSRKPRTVLDWATHFGTEGEAKRALLQRLVAAGILREEQRRFLRVFPYKRYPTEQPGPEHEVVERVRAVLLSSAAPDPPTRALIGLLRTCQVMGSVLDDDEHETVNQRLAEVCELDPTADGLVAAVTQAIVALQTAYAMTMTLGVP